jgi:zinc protease
MFVHWKIKRKSLSERLKMMWSAVKCYLLLMISVLVVLPTGVFAAQYQDITGATLKNGLRVVIVRNSLAPVATVQINYLAGSDEAPPGFPGMAHAQEHMMFRGSPGLSAGQLSAIIAALGGEFNADTEQTVTQYFQTVPAQYLDIALHIEAIRMRGALGSQKLWERERGAIEQEVVQDLSTLNICSKPGFLQLFLPEHRTNMMPSAHGPPSTKQPG